MTSLIWMHKAEPDLQIAPRLSIATSKLVADGVTRRPPYQAEHSMGIWQVISYPLRKLLKRWFRQDVKPCFVVSRS